MPLRINGTSDPALYTELNGPSEKTVPSFSATLAQTQRAEQGKLEQFLTRLDTLGKNLAQTLSLQDLAEFRNTISSFLQESFGKSRKMQEESFYDPYGRPKILARITQVNQALDELGQQILHKHTKQFDILKKIDQIRGLILDLFA